MESRVVRVRDVARTTAGRAHLGECGRRAQATGRCDVTSEKRRGLYNAGFRKREEGLLRMLRGHVDVTWWLPGHWD